METSYNMKHDLESDTLPSLLSILNAKETRSSIASVVNATTTDLMCKLLSGEDYLNRATQLDHTTDSQNLLDFILHMLRYRLLPNQDESVDFNGRARRFMFKIITKTPVIPWSLIATRVSQPTEQDHIGSGRFGHVYKSELNGEAVALKVLYKSDNALAFCREALMWGSLKHKFVLPFLGIDEQPDGTTFLISPYMANGTLAQWRKQANPSVSEMEERILEVALGIEYIHSEGIVHGDLRGESVLLDANLHVQIADFGLTRLSGATNTRSGAKHMHFAAPELFGSLDDDDDDSADDSARTQMSDIYAFGCLYYEIHYDSIPFAGRQGLQIMTSVSKGIRPPRLDDPPLKDEAWELIEWCWATLPSKRPAIKDVAEMMMSDADRHPLLYLLFILKDWKPGSCITSVVNASIIDLVCRILDREDYLSVADQLSQASDVQNLLDFLLHLLRDRRLSNSDPTMDINGRARRLMFKLNSKIPVIPPSLIITGVNMLAERNYIGSGGFGRVFEGKLQEEVVALKVLYKCDDDVSFCREALMWGSFKHKFVLPFYGIYEVSDGRAPQFFLVSPFMTNGTLAQWRKKTKPSGSEIEERILEVAQGIEYIHSVGAVHGDLRGENVLLDANLRVQIADFGLTRLSDATNTQSGAKHLNFSAPELFGIFDDDDLNDVPARTQMTDVYAFGCLFYEIHYDVIPFAGKTDLQMFKIHSRGDQPPRLDHPPLSDGGWHVIQRCWEREALKRPGMKHVAENIMALSQGPTTEIDFIADPGNPNFDGLLENEQQSCKVVTDHHGTIIVAHSAESTALNDSDPSSGQTTLSTADPNRDGHPRYQEETPEARDSSMRMPRGKLEKEEANKEKEDPVLQALLEEGETERDERDSEEEVPSTHTQYGDLKKEKQQSDDVPVLVTSNSSTITRNSVNHPPPALLSRLREKQPRSPITSVVNASTTDLLRNLLSLEDYVHAAEQLNNPSDVETMLEFILFVLRNGYFSSRDTNVDTNRRARRLMSKIISRSPSLPRSLFLTRLTMLGDRPLIGGGGSGLVFKGEHEGKAVALNVLHKTRKNVDFCREALMWRSLHHRFVLPFLGIYENEVAGQIFLASPYMTNGTLSQWRKKQAPSLLEIEKRLEEVARGIHYIHSEGVVHGDLCGDNILLDAELEVKITDFGLTRRTALGTGALRHNFAAPELFACDSEDSTTRTHESDIYAFGCLYYEIHYGTIPFERAPAMHIVLAICQRERPPRLDDPPLSDDAWRLIHQCWAHEKWKRPGIRDVVKIMKSWRFPPEMTPTAILLQSAGSTPATSLRSSGSASTNRHSISGGSSGQSASVNARQSRVSGSNYHNGNVANISENIPPVPLPFRLAPARPKSSRARDEMSIAIDFGTTFSGVAYGSTRATGGKFRQILNWSGHLKTFRKIPTCLLYDRDGRVRAWGLAAKNTNPLPDGTMRCESFKLYLEPKTLRNETADPRLPRLPPGKKAIDVITDFFICLWQYAKAQITKEIGAVADLDTAEIWLAVPAVWDAKGCDIMRQAAINAGLVQSVKAGDVAWRDRLHIITEPEAAAVHCAFLTDVHHLTPSQNFMIVDAGGRTCDLAVYKIIGQMTELEIADMCARSGANCGSIFLDLRFRELVKILLSGHPAHLDPSSLAYFMDWFSKANKLAYRGCADDDLMFNFNCFDHVDPDDQAIGLIGGKLHIRGSLLRENVFDPVVNQVLTLIEEQLTKVEEPIHALFLVGGFAGSEYLKQRVEETFSSKIKLIVRPPDSDTATLRGAAQYGLSKRQLVSLVIAPRSYMVKVKLPAEEEDRMKRPAYLEKNGAGTTICQNRLQYLLVKGTILRRGQRSTTKFCKFSQNSLDSIFVTTLYANESDMVMRYTDQGQMTEVCKWTVDLAKLPTFVENAKAHRSGGFYTEFQLGLELGSVEVLGVLLYKDQPLESVTLDYF